MAKEQPTKSSTSSAHIKLPRLPQGQKIQKRPLLHPAIASPRTNSSTPKVVYVSATSPFISTVKRVRKLLSFVEERSSGPIHLNSHKLSALKQIEDRAAKARKGGGEEVILKATGKATEKLLRLAIWFQGQEDLTVRVRTGSVGAVDDVVGAVEDGEEVEESSRVRRTSCLEILVGLR